MARGDHIRVRRTLYTHHGIDLGDGRVIHSPAEPGRMGDTLIQIATLEKFLRGGTMEVVSHADALPADEIVARAESRLGEPGYHILLNNCEHFARWCVCGDHRSRQVERLGSQAALLGMASRVGLSWMARRAGSKTLVRIVPLVGPVLSTVAVAGTAVSLLSRLRSEARPATPPR